MYHPLSADVQTKLPGPPHGASAAIRDAGHGTHYLIQDPYHEYGQSFIDHIHREYGYRAICIYTDRRDRAAHATHALRPGTASIAAAYDFSAERCDDFIDMIRSRYNVIAHVPFNER